MAKSEAETEMDLAKEAVTAIDKRCFHFCVCAHVIVFNLLCG